MSDCRQRHLLAQVQGITQRWEKGGNLPVQLPGRSRVIPAVRYLRHPVRGDGHPVSRIRHVFRHQPEDNRALRDLPQGEGRRNACQRRLAPEHGCLRLPCHLDGSQRVAVFPFMVIIHNAERLEEAGRYPLLPYREHCLAVVQHQVASRLPGRIRQPRAEPQAGGIHCAGREHYLVRVIFRDPGGVVHDHPGGMPGGGAQDRCHFRAGDKRHVAGSQRRHDPAGDRVAFGHHPAREAVARAAPCAPFLQHHGSGRILRVKSRSRQPGG